MKKILKYLKAIGIFIILELFLAFFFGFLNLLGINQYITSILMFISNISIFTYYGLKTGKTTNKKGIINGGISAIILLVPMFLISLILYFKSLNLWTIVYYIMLMVSSIIGSTIGKNTKKETNIQDKN